MQAAYELRDIQIYNCTSAKVESIETHIFSNINSGISIKREILEKGIKTIISESEHKDISKPIIHVNKENMQVNSKTKQHFKENKRVKLIKESGDSSGWNGMESMMGGLHPFENNEDKHDEDS